MTLNDLRELINQNRKNILIIVLILALAGSVLIYYLSNQGKAPEDGGETPAEKAWKSEQFSFSGDTRSIKDTVDLANLQNIVFPNTAAIYQVQVDEKTISSQEAGELATSFGFTEEVKNRVDLQEGGTMLVYVKDNENIAIFTQPREILYSFKDVTSTVSKATGKIFDKDSALREAEDFLKGRNLATNNLVLYDVRYFIYKAERVEEASKPGTANAVEVSFVRGVGGSKILGESTTEPDALVVFDRAGSVVSLTYKYQDSSFSLIGETELLTYSEAIARLQKEGLVILILLKEGTGKQDVEISDLNTFTPRTVSLAYYQPPGSVFLHPIYIFDGKGTMGGIAVSATVILPARKP